MKEYYECHITMDGAPSILEQYVNAIGWKFSAIDGDPDLGSGVKCYATMHFNARKDFEEIKGKLVRDAAALSAVGVKVLRRKIEMVLYDNREIA